MKRRKPTRKLDVVRRRSQSRGGGRAAPAVETVPEVAKRTTRHRVAPKNLCWTCDPKDFDFRSTREIQRGSKPGRSGGTPNCFIGQKPALEALKMGLGMDSPGYNVFVCGLSGGDKMPQLVDEVRRLRKKGRRVSDRVYVQNFGDPRRPRLLELPAGKGHRFQDSVSQILGKLNEALEKVPPTGWRRRANEILDEQVAKICKRYPYPQVEEWIDEWQRQMLAGIRTALIEDFEVNCLGQPVESNGANVVVETTPTHANLFGWIGRRGVGDQTPVPHFTEIRRGSYLEADGGVLVIDANDLFCAPGAWSSLKNCLKYGNLEIQDGDPSAPARSGIIKPEPIPTQVKIVLVGDYVLYDYLFDSDPDFAELFKIRVDFQPEIQLSSRVLKRDYPRFVAGICESEGLRAVTASGVARIVQYAVRKAGRRNKISAQTALVADVLREADYWAGVNGRRNITDKDVSLAIHEAVDRVNFLEKRIAEMISEGTILISTSGANVGQVNGLAIYDMGDYLFGKPSRITCETSVGQGGIINIERESGFSGRSHDKGVQILAGYLRSRFAQNRPLSLTASVCFEQSYSGIDGDSASATEIYAILSSLSGLPIRQDLAVTGSLSQKGDIQPIGGVNEKIEGFFDCVRAGRPTGTEGVIIPKNNVEDLMLRGDVVRAVERGEFHIYSIDNVTQGLEILTGRPAGKRRKDGKYPDGTVFALVDQRLEELANDLRRYGDE
ncbi:MAG: AAA family ATPase [Planctomycetota bacterium]